MQYNAFMNESLCCKMIRILYHSFFESVFFRIFAGSVRAMSAMLKGIISNSESRRLFISSCSACRGNAPYFILAVILSILICHISAGLLIFGKIRYMSMSLFCIVLFAIYLVRKGVIKYTAAIYFNSYVFRLISRKSYDRLKWSKC